MALTVQLFPELTVTDAKSVLDRQVAEPHTWMQLHGRRGAKPMRRRVADRSWVPALSQDISGGGGCELTLAQFSIRRGARLAL